MATLIVKITFGTDIRRFTAHVASLNWATIAKRTVESFDLAAKKFKMSYVDDEGDKITLSSDEELNEAIGLARSCTPAVLRLTAHAVDETEGKKKTEEKKTGETKAPREREVSAHQDVAAFVERIAKQLPMVANQLPEAVRNILPHAELDLAATVAANMAGAAANMASGDAFVHPHPAGGEEGVHEGVTCDKSGVCPIVGNRYHLVGHNYDLCEAEFEKLPDKEKALFKKIAPPGTDPAAATPVGFHPGVTCDRSGMTPIIGTRYKLRGYNYDLCEAEFQKLDDSEKAQYDAIAPPFTAPATADMCNGGAWRGHCRGGWGRGWGGAFGKGMGGKGKGCGKGGGGGAESAKFSARFISDVTIFDGTQVAPNTKFTKIWKIKNCGEAAWPAGTRMLFVGGDQMTTEMSVPIGRDSPVMPGEEVDVAVEMTAPPDLGRYLGYWRLTGPHCRRKWGQRVWCHIQVVDPSQPAGAVDVESAMAEFEKMKSKLTADTEEGEDDGSDEQGEAPAAAAADSSTPMASTSTAELAATDVPMTDGSPVPSYDANAVVASATIAEPTAEAVAEPADYKSGDEDTVLVDDKMIVEAQPTATATPPAPPPPPPLTKMIAEEQPTTSAAPKAPLTGVALVKAELKNMGFLDETMVEAVVAKHGEDLDGCLSDLAAASEWESLLDDLAEMGFQDRDLNKTLMLKHNGNIKRTVKDLVEA